MVDNTAKGGRLKIDFENFEELPFMKTKNLFFILLAMSLVLFLVGCDGSSSSSSDFDDEVEAITKGSGKKFVVTDITPRTGITNFSVVSGKGIKFKTGDTPCEIYITIILNDNKQFTSTEKALMGGMLIGNEQFTGTWSQSGTTVTTIATKKKDLETGKTESCNQTKTASLSADGKTLTDIDLDPNLSAKFVYTKQ